MTASPYDVAVGLGLQPHRRAYLTWDQVVDLACEAYWQHRIVHGARCGSIHGFYDHRNRGQVACGPCRKARAQIVAITRLRKTRTAA